MWNDAKALNIIANFLFGLAVLALLGAGVWWVIQRPMFVIHTVRVESVEHTPLRHVNALTIRASALPRVEGNFFTTDLDSVRDAFESVPWVRRAMVRRAWPDKLVVTIEEYQPLGTWGGDDQLLSTKGDVFVANLAEAEEDRKLLSFDGPEGSEQTVLQTYELFKQWFGAAKLVPDGVFLSKRYAWSVHMADGMTVELGREQDEASLKARVDRLISVYPQLESRLDGKVARVDMRYPNGLALQADGLVLSTLKRKK